MAGLDPPATRAATADLEVVADADRPRWGQLLDILGRDALTDQLAAAAGTASRQPDHHHPVDLLGWGWLPMAVAAMGRPHLATRAVGVGDGGVA